MAIAGMFALLVSFTFSVAVRFGRIAQLRNDIDRFDEETIETLKQRADRYFKEKGEAVEIETWLVEPNQSIGLMTPLEGIRYRGYRSSLFDSFRPKSSGARVKEAERPSSSGDSRTAAIAAPPMAPGLAEPADAGAEVVPIPAVRR
jgi:hypothetical protein